MFARAKTDPGMVIVLSYDDTSAFGFPHMTNRGIKGMPFDRVYMVPFNLTNHGTEESVYMYNKKGRWAKGADRLCTNLFQVLHRIKTKPDDECTFAEKMQKSARS